MDVAGRPALGLAAPVSFEPSIARRGFDWLLASCPHLDVVTVEWQYGPWLLVTLGQLGEGAPDAFALHPYAIWRSTGAVYGMHDGAVDDDPLFVPEPARLFPA